MTPQGILGNSLGAKVDSPNIYNQVSSMGLSEQQKVPEESQEQPKMESLVDKAMKRFGVVFQHFVDLTESYPGSDKEAKMVKDALANWINSVANRLNESEGNSTY